MTHSSPDHPPLRLVAEEAAIRVRSMLVEAFDGAMTVERKANFHDVVSKHDRAAERCLRELIFERCPDSTIIGEEDGRHGTGRIEWLVDPIDGTENFVSAIPFFCVSIAAAVDGEVVAGVVYDPLRDECFSADVEGAYLNSRPMLADGATRDRDALLIVGYPDHQPWHDAPAEAELDREFGRMVRSFRTVRRIGSSALSLAYVAAGRADVAFDINIRPWDVAAGSLLVQRAGGEYVPLGGAPGPAHQAPGYLATVRDFDVRSSSLAWVEAASQPTGMLQRPRT
jgi:myo-inositol-1(or 4)-monophosphatase